MAPEGNRGALGKIGLVLAGLLGVSASDPARAEAPSFAPKVLVVTMFGGEAKPWLEGETLTRRIAVPGLAKAYPEIACTDSALRPFENLLSYRRNCRRRSWPGNARFGVLGALCDRRRAAERD
jgi:hypothetical protein